MELPTHLGTEEDQYHKSSPVEFLLVPISEYCSDVDIMLAGISDGLMTLATEAMLSLNAVMLKIRTLEATYIANKFMDMQSILKLFDTELQIFTLSFKRQLQTILPAVRSGGGEEDLSLLLLNYTDSPFFYDTSYFFLSERETEINTINHLFEDVQGPNATADSHILIGDQKSANIAEALLKKTFVVIYKFNVFTTRQVTEQFLYNKTMDQDTWFNDYKSIGEAGYRWRNFKTFVEENAVDETDDIVFFIQGASIGDNLSQIEIYENGFKKAENFEVPFPPPTPSMAERGFDYIILDLGPREDIGNSYVDSVRITYEYLDFQHGVINGTFELRTVIVDAPIKETDRVTVQINELRPGFFYVFEARWLTSYGQGPPSEKTSELTTLPSSPPVKLALEYPDPYSVLLSWDDPLHISSSVPAVVLEGFEITWTGKNRLPVHPTTVLNTIATTTPSLTSITTNLTETPMTTSHLSEPAQWLLQGEESPKTTSIGEVFVKGNNVTIKKLDPATHYQFTIIPKFSTVGDPNPSLEGSKAEISGTTIPTTPPMPHQLNISIHEVQIKMADIEDLVLATGARFKHFILSYFKVNSTTSDPQPGSPNEQIAVDSTWTVSGLAMGTDYHFLYKFVTTMGDSLLSPPLAVKTPYNKTDLDEFRDSLGLEEMKEELRGYAHSEDEKLEAVVEAYADSHLVNAAKLLMDQVQSEDEQLESRLHQWVWDNWYTHPNLTLEGSNAGPNRGTVYLNGRPLCDDDINSRDGNSVWDLDDATVVCRMLGFSKATKEYHDNTEGCFGSCSPAGIPFAMSGFQCTGTESHILDCPHDATVSSACGDHNGVTDSA